MNINKVCFDVRIQEENRFSECKHAPSKNIYIEVSTHLGIIRREKHQTTNTSEDVKSIGVWGIVDSLKQRIIENHNSCFTTEMNDVEGFQVQVNELFKSFFGENMNIYESVFFDQLINQIEKDRQ